MEREDTCRIFLWGPMGSGKSYLGRPLAQAMQLPFFDLDAIIVAGENQSISDLFRELGEKAFRKLEQTYLQRTLQTQTHFLMATGGGTPCFFDNAEQMLNAGLCIYLDTAIPVLVGRLSGEKAKRPILNSLSDHSLGPFLQRQIAERSVFYEKAHLIYSIQGPEQNVLSEILQYLQRIIPR